jgi:hypothetical protein
MHRQCRWRSAAYHLLTMSRMTARRSNLLSVAPEEMPPASREVGGSRTITECGGQGSEEDSEQQTGSASGSSSQVRRGRQPQRADFPGR